MLEEQAAEEAVFQSLQQDGGIGNGMTNNTSDGGKRRKTAGMPSKDGYYGGYVPPSFASGRSRSQSFGESRHSWGGRPRSYSFGAARSGGTQYDSFHHHHQDRDHQTVHRGVSVLYRWQQPGADGLIDVQSLHDRKAELREHNLALEPDLLTEWCVLVEELDLQLKEHIRNKVRLCYHGNR